MATAKQDQLDLEPGERIVWSSPAQLASAMGARPGSFVKTNFRLAFLPRKVALGKAPSWTARVEDVTSVEPLQQWRLPYVGIARPNRVRVRSSSGAAVFFFPDQALAVTALSPKRSR